MKHLVTLEGHLGNKTELPVVDFNAGDRVMIDLEKVKTINSMGVSHWVKWMDQFAEGEIILFNVPVAMVLQANNIDGFMPDNASVSSFFVPYICEETQYIEDVLYVDGRDYKTEESLTERRCLSPKTGNPMQIDAVPGRYFKFLKLP